MQAYLDLCKDILNNGVVRPDARTGEVTTAVFGRQLRFVNNPTHFPAVTTKQLAFKSMAAELAGFLEGASTLERFQELGTNIWNTDAANADWMTRAKFPGDLGRMYGVQWRGYVGVNRHGDTVALDQMKQLVDGLQNNPYGRRHLVTAYNPVEVDQQCLPPCHVLFQCFVRPGANDTKVLDLMWYQRSVDVFLGLPFNIASYALLQRILASQLGYYPGELVASLGDTHIYHTHLEQVKLQLSRVPYGAPMLLLRKGTTIDNFTPAMAELLMYEHHAPIKGAMATGIPDWNNT